MHKDNDEKFYREALRYNEEMAEFLSKLIGELNHPIPKKWAKSLRKRCLYHAEQHSKALANLTSERENDLIEAALDLIAERINKGVASAEETIHYVQLRGVAATPTALSPTEVYQQTSELIKSQKNKKEEDVKNEDGVGFSDMDGEVLTNPEPEIEVADDRPCSDPEQCKWAQYHTDDQSTEMYDDQGHGITEEGYNKMIEEQA